MEISVVAVLIFCLFVFTTIAFFKPYDYGSRIKQFKKIANPETDIDPADDTLWRSVKVRPGLNCCKPVLSLQDEVFLGPEVPTLPLDYCTEPNCSCHYLFYDDRRSGLDRRVNTVKIRPFLSGMERRRSYGRRLADLAA